MQIDIIFEISQFSYIAIGIYNNKPYNLANKTRVRL